MQLSYTAARLLKWYLGQIILEVYSQTCFVLLLNRVYLIAGFSIMDSAPNSHKFKLTMFQPTDPQNFFRTVRKEIKLLRSSLPPGIWVKGFEDRMVSVNHEKFTCLFLEDSSL